jgi:hypothetical protein
MHKYVIVILLLLLFSIILYAQDNHMDIMTTMTGEHDFFGMGYFMTTLDFNGDGYDDLVISENGWRPTEYIGNNNVRSFGKLNFYFGGQSFDNVPEMEIPGHHEIEFSHTTSMCNAGDMNGDGIYELALFRATMYEDNNSQHYDLQLCIFYGGATPDTISDYVITFPRDQYNNGGTCSVSSLGDINDDGFDDLGYVLRKNIPNEPYAFFILYGATMINQELLEAGSHSGPASFTGIGDINGDGIADFSIGYLSDSQNWHQRITLFYGNTTGVYSDSVVVGDANISRPQTYPVGDINRDGFADFATYFCNNNFRLYYGGSVFNPSNYVLIAPTYNGDISGWGFGHGDVNGDGTDDIMGTNFTQADGYGDAYLWICGVPMNGSPDLHITPPSLPWPAMIDSEMFGWCLTMGDYNGDGCCDVAISAPFDYAAFPEPGHVFVYAGNHQLNDPTPISDDTQTPAISKMQLYPNPLQPQNSSLNVKFNKQTGNQSSTFEIYNIKGQKVKSFIITAEQSKAGSTNYNLNDLSSGVYLCVYTNTKQQIKGKITIMK